MLPEHDAGEARELRAGRREDGARLFVTIGRAAWEASGAGFLGPAFDPMVVNADLTAAEFTAGELTVADGLTEGRLMRHSLIETR